MAVTFDATLCSSRRQVIRRSLRSKTERLMSTSDPSVCDVVSAAISFVGVRESVHRDIIMNTTNEMQLYRLIYYS